MAVPPRVPYGSASLMRSSCRRPRERSKVSMPGPIVGSPTASRLILRAATRYRCSSVGDIESTSAMLSRPWSDSSGGSSVSGSISSASRSRMALPYSNRFRRWSAGRPGFGCAAASPSSSVSSQATNASIACSSGRLRPGGGIAPLRSLRTTFSQVAPSAPMCPTSAWSSSRPAVCSLSLWQATQYWSRRARASGGASGGPAACRAAGRWQASASTTTQPHDTTRDSLGIQLSSSAPRGAAIRLHARC